MIALVPDRTSAVDHRPVAAAAAFRLTPVAAAIVAGLTLASPSGAWAENDKAIADLQAEVARLKLALEKSQQELAAQKAGGGSAAAAVPAGAAKAAEGQDGAAKSSLSAVLDAIVVSRKSQLETLKDVPRSVSVVTGDELERLGATNITDVLRRVGNVNFNYGNPRTGSLTMRGLTTGSNDTIDPSVGVVVDEISYAYTPMANGANYIDVETVDVTRGPQGTLGYKNASVGQITVKNKRPTFTGEAEASLTFGEWNTLKSEAVAGGSVIDGLLAWRGTFLREQGDGYWNNAYPDLKGRSSYVNTDRTYGRVQFLLTPTPDFNARLSVEHQPKGGEFLNGLSQKLRQPLLYRDGTAISATTINAAPENRLARGWFTRTTSFSAADYFRSPVFVDNNGSIITGMKGVTADLNWKVAGHTLQSITGYRNHWFSAANDEGTPFDITKSGGYITEFSQLSQEFRLSSDKGKFVDYTTGLYFITTDNDSITRTRYGSDAGAWFATGNGSAGNLQYGILGNPTAANLALTPTLAISGGNLLRDSLNGLYKGTHTFAKNESTAWYGQADWHLSEPLTLTTGLRLSKEDRRSQQSQLVLDQGVAALLNPVSVNNVQLGGFAANATTGALIAGNSAAQLALADLVAQRYFGAANYAALDPRQLAQVANAKALRAAQITGLYALATAQPFKDDIKTWNISLSDKINDDLTTYVTWQYGEKAGVSQINGSTAAGGTSVLVKPERTNSYELGLRSSLLNKTLTVNADVFLSDIKDFQQSVQYLDPVLTAINGVPTYSSGTGNVKAVQVKGLEVDAAYTGLKNLSLRVAGAYNDARYKDHKLSGLASEINPAGGSFYDVSGKTLPNAPKWSVKVGGEYRLPVFDNKIFHTSANYTYTSRYNVDANLSQSGWVEGYGLLDLGIGIGRQDGLFDVTFLAKNALDTRYHNPGWTSYNLSTPRWLGVQFSSKL